LLSRSGCALTKVGMDDLAAEMKAGDLNYDRGYRSPDAIARCCVSLGPAAGHAWPDA